MLGRGFDLGKGVTAMTEAEWLACTDPEKMVRFLWGKTSHRKTRLFACACCRTVWPSIPAVFRDAIRVTEEHADGVATNVELGRAVSAAHRVRRKRNSLDRAAYDAARSNGDAGFVAQSIARVIASMAAPNPSPTAIGRFVGDHFVTEEIPPNADRLLWNASYASHLRLESDLLRDIIGPIPFRAVTVSPDWLAWKGGTVPKIAQAIYNERAFDRMPILADALEESGCTDADILVHCRQPDEHVRGCWVVDKILGKE
jgi:hypothetical protein